MKKVLDFEPTVYLKFVREIYIHATFDSSLIARNVFVYFIFTSLELHLILFKNM